MAQQVLGDNTHAQLGLGDERPRDAPRCRSARPRVTAQRAHAACPISTRGGTRLVRLVRGRGGGAPTGSHGTRRVRVSRASMRPPRCLRRARAFASADRTVDALAWEELGAVACGRAHSLAASRSGEVPAPAARRTLWLPPGGSPGAF